MAEVGKSFLCALPTQKDRLAQWAQGEGDVLRWTADHPAKHATQSNPHGATPSCVGWIAKAGSARQFLRRQ
jgi:hypothetical protein